MDSEHNSIDWLGPELSAKNADGAAYDTFCVRPIAADSSSGSGFLNILGQQKAYMTSKLDASMLEIERQKCADADTRLQKSLPHGYQLDYVLVVYATRVTEELLKSESNVPAKCILLCGQRLRSYFGNTLCNRAFPILSGDLVNVNTASFKVLETVKGLGEVKCGRIIQARAESLFTDMEDFISRTGIRTRSILVQLEA